MEGCEGGKKRGSLIILHSQKWRKYNKQTKRNKQRAQTDHANKRCKPVPVLHKVSQNYINIKLKWTTSTLVPFYQELNCLQNRDRVEIKNCSHLYLICENVNYLTR